MAATYLRVLFSLLLTGFVLGPWYVEQLLPFQQTRSIDYVMVLLIGLSVLSIALLVGGLGRERPWSDRFLLVAFLASACWVLGIAWMFWTQLQPVGGKARPTLLFAISAAWLPVLAWSTFWPISWLGRVSFVLALLLLQPIFPMLYRVPGRNQQGKLYVIKRSAPNPLELAGTAPATPPASAQPRTNPSQGNVPSAVGTRTSAPAPAAGLVSDPSSIGSWNLNLSDDAKAQLSVGPEPNSIRVQIDGNGGSKHWNTQMSRSGLKLAAGEQMQVGFRARADKARALGVSISQNHAPWENLGLYRVVDVGPVWKNFTFSAAATKAEPDARLVFDLGGFPDSLNIADVRVIPAPTGAPAAPASTSVVAAPTPAAPANSPSSVNPQVSSAPDPTANMKPSPLSGWRLITADGTAVRSTQEAGPVPHQRVHIGPATQLDDWRVRVERDQLALEPGKEYQVTLKGRSNVKHPVVLAVSLPAPPWTGMGLFERLELKPEWQEFTTKFRATAGGPSRLYVNLGGEPCEVDIARLEIAPAPY